MISVCDLGSLSKQVRSAFSAVITETGSYLPHGNIVKGRNEVQNHFAEIGTRKTQEINDEIIKAAEELVFSCRKYPWLPEKVKLFDKFRFETVTEATGPYLISQQQTVEVK